MTGSNMLLIYTKKDNPRLRYTLDVVLKRLLGLDWKLIHSPGDLPEGKHAVINYSQEDIPASLRICPAGLLFETDIREQPAEIITWNGLPVMYPSLQEGIFTFDPFSMIFFLISRYEEYLPHFQDNHSRFVPENSLAFRRGFLHFPIVHLVANELGNYLRKQFPFLDIHLPSWSFTPTVDVDIAYAHLGKGWLRSAGGFGKLAAKGKILEMKQRLAVMAGYRHDPYDNFKMQMDAFREYGLKPVYFILVGDYGRYDKNVSHQNKRFRALLKWLGEVAEVGLHPSYRSFDEPAMIAREKERLQDMTGKEVKRSRQHFLRLAFPESYRRLAAAGIEQDYSMGYASMNGFRAGISVPYPFFDLLHDSEEHLMIHPFAFMDTAMQDYLNVKPHEYLTFVKPLVESVKKCGGNLSGVWHNYALADNPDKHNAFRNILKFAIHDQIPPAG